MEELKEYKEERFEFALFVNNNLICKRNFKINNFIDGSMQTLDFKLKIDSIVNMIHDDLASKSRIFLWYYGDVEDAYQEPLPELMEDLLQPWESTFKFVVYDNHREVLSKIWDGYCYPKSIREKVDLCNKTVKITTKDGKVYTYDKESYFEANQGKLSPELCVIRSMILDKPDLLLTITKKICEACSPREDGYENINDYTLSDIFKTKEYEKNEDGTFKLDENGKLKPKKLTTKGKKYFYSLDMANNKLSADWGKLVSDKTKKYFENLY